MQKNNWVKKWWNNAMPGGNSVIILFQLVILILIAITYTEMASAHARFAPGGIVPPRSDNDGIKSGPCGSDPRSANPPVFSPGQQIIVEWEETINHPGYFRIAFSPADDQGYDDNVLYQVDDNQNDLNVPHNYSATITLPDTECQNCSLQLIQYMTERDPPSMYYSCADIQLVGNNPNNPPDTLQNVVATNGNAETSIAWQYPATGDLQAVILQSTSAITGTPQDGQVLYEGDFVGNAMVVYAGGGSQFVAKNLVPGQTYYYALYAYNANGLYSEGVLIEETAVQVLDDTQAPLPVNNVNSVAGDGQAALSWINPVDDFYKVLVLWDSNPIVSDPINGTSYLTGDYIGTAQVVFNGLGNMATIANLVNGQNYHFRIYAHDAAFNYATGVDTSVFLAAVGENQKPVVSLTVSQNGSPVTNVYLDKGSVTIMAIIEDDNDIAQATISWSGTDYRIIDTDSAPDTITFDPSQLSEGRYTVRVAVADNGNAPQTTTLEMSLLLSSSDNEGAGSMGHLGLLLFLLLLQRYYVAKTRRV